MIKQMKIQTKIGLIVINALLVLVSTNAIGYYYMNAIAKQSEKMYEEKFASVQLLGQIRTENRAIDSRVLEMMVTTDIVLRDELGSELDTDMIEMIQLLSQYGKQVKDGKEKEFFKMLKGGTSAYLSAVTSVKRLAIDGQQESAYKLYMNRAVPSRDKMIQSAEQLTLYQQKGAKELYNQNQSNVKVARIIIVVLGILSSIIFLLLSVIISKGIVKPIQGVKQLLYAAEKGDLTVNGDYQSRDELGQLTRSFNAMVSGLRSVINQVDRTAEQAVVASVELNNYSEETMRAAERITEVTSEVAASAENQLTELTETVVTMNQLSETVRHIADNAQSASVSALHVSGKAVAGQDSLEEAVSQMGSIHERFAQLAERINGLGARSLEISQIVDTITEIADQTSLLALNAAIEAARVGEHGRGFSVVAEEVRRLAEQSAESAKRITNLISTVQSETNQAMITMGAASEEVTKGLEIVQEAGNSFSEIYEATGLVTGQIQEVSAAVQEIAAGTEQMVSNAREIKVLAEKTAAHTEEVSASSTKQSASMGNISLSTENLAEVATLLRQTIRHFSILERERKENQRREDF
ncbi:methyl-accepting chemotaxis protein [Lysinibacillus piscis]|uniref:Methyl-accepting chemotaxis protein n=1 Tax=Lysinibacillus piscis TaxID=2518931 RepID=A0ABQ5NMQ2_9BACI|nr:methyl-accepting chemotaxis protein [Lysinibacillus sp. KH24]GLC89582.1 hypothetical protein LYSBPC_27090 [Lysinibacillus sp. KH24]